MKTFYNLFFVLMTFICFTSARAQTAEDIISKNIDAIGGKDLLEKMNSIYIEGVASVMGMDLPTSEIISMGKGFKSTTTYNGMDIIQCLTDTSGWMVNPVQGAPDPVSLPAEDVKLGKSSLDVRGELYHFREKGYSDSLIGREDYQGVSTYKIKLSQQGIDIVYYIDPVSYYVLKVDAKIQLEGKDLINTTTFSNYKKTDFGFVLAYSRGVTQMGYDVQLTFNKVEINKDIDPKVFALPK